MASHTLTSAPMTANPGRPSRLRVRLRHIRLALRRDPLSTVTTPALAIRLADQPLKSHSDSPP